MIDRTQLNRRYARYHRQTPEHKERQRDGRSPPRRVDSVDGKHSAALSPKTGTLDPARVRRIYSAGTNLSANPFMQ